MRYISIWKSGISRYVFSILQGLACLGAGGLLLAGLLLIGNIPARTLILLMHILWSISAFYAGRCAGFHGRLHGIRTGLLCSILLCLALLTGCMVLHENLTRRLILRCILMLPSGMAGGIVGVNTKLKKPPY